jgi:hypothetical protein
VALSANIRLGCKGSPKIKKLTYLPGASAMKRKRLIKPSSEIHRHQESENLSGRQSENSAAGQLKTGCFFKIATNVEYLYSGNLALLCVAKILWLANRINTRCARASITLG